MTLKACEVHFETLVSSAQVISFFSIQQLHKIVLQVQTEGVCTYERNNLKLTFVAYHLLINMNIIYKMEMRNSTLKRGLLTVKLSRLNGKVLCTKISKAHQNIKNRAFKMFDTKT